MTPESIIMKHIGNIKGMRVPEARFVTAKIIKELAEEGYLVDDASKQLLPPQTSTAGSQKSR